MNQAAQAVEMVARVPCEIGPADDLPAGVRLEPTFDTPAVLWDQGRQAETVIVGEMQVVRLQSYVLVEALAGETIRIVAGHVVRLEAGGSLIDMRHPWGAEAIAPNRSAMLEQELQRLAADFLKSVPQALQEFAKVVRGEA